MELLKRAVSEKLDALPAVEGKKAAHDGSRHMLR